MTKVNDCAWSLCRTEFDPYQTPIPCPAPPFPVRASSLVIITLSTLTPVQTLSVLIFANRRNLERDRHASSRQPDLTHPWRT